MNKYVALRVIAGLYLYGGMTVFILGTIVGVASVVGSINSPFIGTAAASTFFIMIAALSAMAFGQLIQLLISMEQNTRASVTLLNRLIRIQSGQRVIPGHDGERIPMPTPRN